MNPSYRPEIPRAHGIRIGIKQDSYQSAQLLPPQQSPNCSRCTLVQQCDQQRSSDQISWPVRRSIQPITGKVAIEVTRKVSGQTGGKVSQQSVTHDLGQHALEAVADRKLDTRCCTLFCRHEVEADLALGRGAAPLIAADSDDPAGQIFNVALEARCAAELGRNRSKSYADRAIHALRRRHAGQRRAGQAGGNLPDIAKHVEDDIRRIGDREILVESLCGRKVRNGVPAIHLIRRFGLCRDSAALRR